MPISANLDKILDKAYENSAIADILAAPVTALAGVSDGDAQLLSTAFGINTVSDLGRNKFFRAAAALADLNG